MCNYQQHGDNADQQHHRISPNREEEMEREAPQQKQFPKPHVVERRWIILGRLVGAKQTTVLVDVDLELMRRYIYQNFQG